MNNLEKLEFQLMYQESIIDELNKLVIDMQKELTIVNKKIELLKKKIQELEDNKEIESKRPPHY